MSETLQSSHLSTTEEYGRKRIESSPLHRLARVQQEAILSKLDIPEPPPDATD